METNKYKKGQIYKIVDKAYNECYYGSTVDRLSQRLSCHKSKYKLYKNKESTFITAFILFDRYGPENCKIELVEDYPCESKTELNRREGYWIENNKCVNKIYDYNNKEQDRDIYNNKYKDTMREWYEKNKGTLQEKIKCECGSLISKHHLLEHQKTQKHLNLIKKNNTSDIINS
jgi:hypothetical protein